MIDAFHNYKAMSHLWMLYNYSNIALVDDSCLGYLRNVICWSEFPACVDNGDGTWHAAPICNQYCKMYKLRCGSVKYLFIYLLAGCSSVL